MIVGDVGKVVVLVVVVVVFLCVVSSVFYVLLLLTVTQVGQVAGNSSVLNIFTFTHKKGRL